jgi:hypothetical protein
VRHILEKLKAIEIHLTVIVLEILILCQSKFLLI